MLKALRLGVEYNKVLYRYVWRSVYVIPGLEYLDETCPITRIEIVKHRKETTD